MDLRDRIPREKMMEIVDDLIEMDVRAVTFSGGGEPLIYPHLAETVQRLAAGGIRIGCLTNGAALLFLLWYLTPRTIFESEGGEQIASAH